MIPDSVAEINKDAFYSCERLTGIVLPSGLRAINDRVFDSCTSLTGITIPSGVTSIGDSAFYDCTSLTAVLFTGNAPSVKSNAFQTYDSDAGYIPIPGLTLYYIEGSSGWTTPLWNGYPTAIWGSEHTHSYISSVTAPTCTEQGFTTHTCSVCGDSYTDTYVDALGHSAELQNVTAPTCTEDGYSGDEICTVCGETVVVGEAIPAHGHSYEDAYCVYCGQEHPIAGLLMPFSDIPENAWYVDAVKYVANHGLMNGVSESRFNPEGTMTRAMLVTVLWRYAEEPAGVSCPFDDVKPDLWYTEAVAWASSCGLVNGAEPTRFSPDGSVTREQIATILYRYATYLGIDTSVQGDLTAFPDAGEVADWAIDAMQWCVSVGIFDGSNGQLLPQANATRAQVAAILMRFIENVVNG